MRCSTSRLLAYRRRELGWWGRWRMERHLAYCPACRDLLEVLEEMAREVEADGKDDRGFPQEGFPGRGCLSEEVWGAYAAGVLPDAHRDQILDHLVECPFCERQALTRGGGSTGSPPGKPGKGQGTRERGAGGTRFRPPGWGFRVGALAGSLLLLGALVWVGVRPSGEPRAPSPAPPRPDGGPVVPPSDLLVDPFNSGETVGRESRNLTKSDSLIQLEQFAMALNQRYRFPGPPPSVPEIDFQQLPPEEVPEARELLQKTQWWAQQLGFSEVLRFCEEGRAALDKGGGG